MEVAIIGSGNVGKALAGSATKAGHEVSISANDPQHAQDAAKATHAHAAASNQDAVKGADLFVLAVPANKVDQLVARLAPELGGKVVVDVTNRVDAKDPGNVLDGSSVAEQIQKTVPTAHVVKAFNYAFASKMRTPRWTARTSTRTSPATMKTRSERSRISPGLSGSGRSTLDRSPWHAPRKA
jgi:predicted dinucleotide-binding enzyme